VRLLVDTGVFSATLSGRRRPEHEPLVARLPGNQLNLAVQTVAELRFGALVAGWADARRRRLEHAIEEATVIPVSDALVSAVAQLRFECRVIGHPLAGASHHADLWIAATAIHVGAQLVTADRIFDDVPGLLFV
jgi:predicted nucleic acid-binding protein